MNSTTLQKPRLIGLYSTVPQCGKTTCAQFLANAKGYDYAHIPLAGAIKHLTVVVQSRNEGTAPTLAPAVNELANKSLPVLNLKQQFELRSLFNSNMI